MVPNRSKCMIAIQWMVNFGAHDLQENVCNEWEVSSFRYGYNAKMALFNFKSALNCGRKIEMKIASFYIHILYIYWKYDRLQRKMDFDKSRPNYNLNFDLLLSLSPLPLPSSLSCSLLNPFNIHLPIWICSCVRLIHLFLHNWVHLLISRCLQCIHTYTPKPVLSHSTKRNPSITGNSIAKVTHKWHVGRK